MQRREPPRRKYSGDSAAISRRNRTRKTLAETGSRGRLPKEGKSPLVAKGISIRPVADRNPDRRVSLGSVSPIFERSSLSCCPSEIRPRSDQCRASFRNPIVPTVPSTFKKTYRGSMGAKRPCERNEFELGLQFLWLGQPRIDRLRRWERQVQVRLGAFGDPQLPLD